MKSKQITLLKKELRPLEKLLGVSFKKPSLLMQAITHSSFKNEFLNNPSCDPDKLLDNERLEFFGDAILSFTICKKLYQLFTDDDEGTLSKYRSLLVSRKMLFTVAKKIKLHQFIKLGKSEQNIKFKDKAKMLADSFEAVIAVIYIDRGIKVTEDFISRFFDPYLSKTRLNQMMAADNSKCRLQEIAQKTFHVLPKYRHVYKDSLFTSTVYIKRKSYGSGTGRSKRIAEKEAAKETLKILRNQKKKTP